jgi:hypothetical protein
VVTNSDNTIIYIEGIDYTVEVVGTSASIQRNPLGRIENGQSILVDYTFTPQAPFETTGFGYRLGGRLRLVDLFSFYYNFFRFKEELESGTLPADLRDDTIQRAEAELQWRWSTTRLEYELRDTTVTPLTRWRALQQFNFSPRRGLVASIAGQYSVTELEDPSDRITNKGLSARLGWVIAPWGQFDVNAFTERYNSNTQSSTNNGLVARWGWRYGAWFGDVRYERLNQSYDPIEQTRDRQVIRLEVQRRF